MAPSGKGSQPSELQELVPTTILGQRDSATAFRYKVATEPRKADQLYF